MNAKEAIESIKKLVFGEENPTPEPAPEVFGTEYKLADGTPIMIDKLEVGGIAKLGGMVAPDGTHYLEDGTEIEIKDGVISMVKSKEADPKEIEIEMGKELEALNKFAETATPDQKPMVTIVKALFENVFGWQIREAQERATREAAIEAYKTSFNDQKEVITKITVKADNLQKANEELVKLVEFLAEEPAASPIKPEVKFEEMTPLERFRFNKELQRQN